MPAWKEPNELCQDVAFDKYAAFLPTVPRRNDLGWVPGGQQKLLSDVVRGDPWRTLSYRTSAQSGLNNWFEPIGVEVGSLFVEGIGLYAQDSVQVAYNTGNTDAIAAQKEDLLHLLSMSKWVTLGGERCLTWEEPLEGNWKLGYTPGDKNAHTMDWWAIGSSMIDMYRNDHDASWLPWIDGLYNWSRQYLYTRNDLHDVPSSPFSLVSSLVCPFLVDFYETFRTDPERMAKAEDALTMARSYYYRTMAVYLGDSDPGDSLDSSFLIEPTSGQGWAGSACVDTFTPDTAALMYVYSGDQQLKYYLRGILERFYELYRSQTVPVQSIDDYAGSSAFTEAFGLFDGCVVGKGVRVPYGISGLLFFCFPIGQSSMRVLCGPKAAISFDKDGTSSDISDYRCNPDAGFSFRVVGANADPFDVSVSYPLRDVHLLAVKRTRGGIVSSLVKGRDYETYADSPANIMLRSVRVDDVIMVGDTTTAVPCQPADLDITHSILATSTDTGNYRMVALPYATSVSIDWNDNDSWAGLLPGKQNAWGVPYYIQPPTLAPGKVAASGSIQLPSPTDGFTDAYVIYSPATTNNNVALAFADGTSMTYTDIPVSAWHSWPENFDQRLVMARFVFPADKVPVRVEAGANLVFAVTLGKDITARQLSWYGNGLTAARTQAAIDRRYALTSQLVASRIGDRSIALIPPVTGVNFTAYRMGGLASRMDVLTERQLVDADVFNAARYPVALYTGVEDYIRTVTTDGDGEQAIRRYLSQGGVLIFAAPMGGTWPMHYAVDSEGKRTPDPLLPRLGIPMYGPWESPPGPLTVSFSATQNIVTGLPASLPYPTSGDLRLRLADMTRVGSDVRITPILTMDGLGSPAFLASFVSGPMKGGQVLYVWSRFLDQSYSDTFYEGITRFIANEYTAAPATLTATVTDGKVVLTWPAGIPGNRTIAAYGIYRSDASGTYTATPTTTVDTSVLTWTDTVPVVGTNSYYTVRAVDAGTPTRTSGASPEASIITAFRISAKSSTHGTLGVPLTLVPRGSSTTVTLHPAQGWRLTALFDNGNDVTSRVTSTGYAITDIQADHVLLATFGVIPDTTGPVITVTTPSSTSERDAFISGSVTDALNGVASLSVQGSPVSIRPDSTFVTTVHLMMGTNNIVLEAVDGVGNVTTKKVSIMRILPTTTIEVTIQSTMMLVNDKPTYLDTAPMIIGGRTMLPIRALIEALGGTVEWDPSLRSIRITLGARVVVLTVNKNTADVDGRTVKLDVPPAIKNGRTLVPLRFVAENLGCQVAWDPATRTATVVWQG
jgi:hypothetical protein